MRMVDALDNAAVASNDVPDYPPSSSMDPPVIHTGKPGRPRAVIDKQQLSVLSQGRATNNDVAKAFGISPSTVRRRKLEYNLSEAGPPVYTSAQSPDGSTTRIYRPGVCSSLSKLTDDQLDALVLQCYQQFPTFGRTLIDGYLLDKGERVPRRRVMESYRRVVGLPVRAFGERRLWRRTYHVPGPNSLWHHDGNHCECISLVLLHCGFYPSPVLTIIKHLFVGRSSFTVSSMVPPSMPSGFVPMAITGLSPSFTCLTTSLAFSAIQVVCEGTMGRRICCVLGEWS